MNSLLNIRKLLSTNGVKPLTRFYSETIKHEKSLNNVQLLGRVGGEPLKRGTEIHPVVIFSMATNSNYKDQNGNLVQKTEWHRICVFNTYLQESVSNYLKKGKRIFVKGRLSYGEINTETGVKLSTSIIADDVIFLQS